jgi:MFS transporter, FHS family, L-fucose permease
MDRQVSADDIAQRPSQADVDFRRKSVANKGLTGASALTVRQSIFPITLVTVLFFLWGFAYGLLDVLNAKFQTSLNITAARAGGLQGSYFGAYFIGPLTYSGWIVRRFGYRWTFITGLVIYGVGALMFWPSAVYKSFGGFCGSLFIVGSGLSTLETSANPFIATCGPPRLSEFRLELSQSFQAVGSVVAPLLAARVFFKNTEPTDLSKVQWTYVGIAAFVFLLAVVFFFSPIPEVTDADMALQAEQCADLTGYQEKPLRKQYKLFFGVAAQFTYVGAQVAVASQFIRYAQESAGITESQASDRYAIGQALFAIGRFAAAGLFMFVKPRLVLMVFVSPPTYLPWIHWMLTSTDDNDHGLHRHLHGRLRRRRRGNPLPRPLLRILHLPHHLHPLHPRPRPPHKARLLLHRRFRLRRCAFPCTDGFGGGSHDVS